MATATAGVCGGTTVTDQWRRTRRYNSRVALPGQQRRRRKLVSLQFQSPNEEHERRATAAAATRHHYLITTCWVGYNWLVITNCLVITGQQTVALVFLYSSGKLGTPCSALPLTIVNTLNGGGGG